MGSPLIWFGTKAKLLKSILNFGDSAAEIHSGSTDPTAGGGVVAPLGSLYLNASTGIQYRKTAAGNTAWEPVVTGAAGANTELSNLGVTSINADLLPSGASVRLVGSSALPFNQTNSTHQYLRGGSFIAYDGTNNSKISLNAASAVTLPSGTSSSANIRQTYGTASGAGLGLNGLGIFTDSGGSNSAQSGKINIETGNATGTASDSGDITLQTGTATQLRGKVVLNGRSISIANGTTDPTSPAEGDLYYNTTSYKLRLYANGAWTSVAAPVNYIDRFSGDGSDTTFDLSVAPANENDTMIFISGLHQDTDTYSIAGTTITFVTAPPIGSNNIVVRYQTY